MADELLQMFQSITTHDHDELVDQFAYLLQLDPTTATFFLESSNWNVETAVNNYLATMEAQGSQYFGDTNDQDDDRPNQHQQQQQQEGEDLDMESEDAGSSINQRFEEADYHAQFISDLSESQNMFFPPNATVNMQWSFINTGNTAWPAGTALVFSQGDQFDGPQEIPVSVAAGARIDIQVALRMPPNMGSYAGSWRLRNPSGFFGDPVWVIFSVGTPKQDAFEPADTANDGSKLSFNHTDADRPSGFMSSASTTFVGGPTTNDNDEMMDL